MQRNKSLQALAEEFISYKQDIGYIYETQEKYLVNYVMYAEKHSPGISLPNKVTIVNFIDTLSHSPGSQYNVLRPGKSSLELPDLPVPELPGIMASTTTR